MSTALLPLVCGVVLSATAAATPQWRIIEPPPPGQITTFGVAAGNTKDVSVGTNPDGGWTTADVGNEDLGWLSTSMGLFEVHMTAVPIAHGDSNWRYSMNDGGGVHRSANGGIDWIPRASIRPGCCPPVGKPWVALAPGPVFSPHPMLLGGGDGLIRRSIDDAASWTTASGVPTDVMVTDIEFVTRLGTDQYAWAATSDCALWDDERACAKLYNPLFGGHGVLFTNDQGVSWTERLIDPDRLSPKNFVNALATVPGIVNTLVAATEDGLWGTLDGGATWTDLTPPLVSSSRRITDVSFTGSPSAQIHVGTERGIWRGDVAAVNVITWARQDGFPADFVTALGSVYDDSTRLYVGYEDGAIWTSANADSVADTTEVHGAHGGYPFATLSIDSGDEDNVYTGTVCQHGIFKASIPSLGTVTWDHLERTVGEHFHYVMRIDHNPIEGDILYATESDWLWGSTDAGGTWTEITPPPGGLHLHGLAVAPRDQNVVYVGSGHGNWGTQAITFQVSLNGNFGAAGSWIDHTRNLNDILAPATPCGNFERGTSLMDIVVSPTDWRDVYVGTFGSENYPGDTCRGMGQGVVRSLDGMDWEQINTGLNPVAPDNLSLWVGQVTMTVEGGRVITYIATLDGLFKMVGITGTSWTRISPAGVDRWESIAVDPVDPRIVYAGTSELPFSGSPARIYRSLDSGDSWTPMNIQMEPLAWSDQYRVRDIQVGVDRAYAVIEGSGTYMLNKALIGKQVKGRRK